MSARIVRNSMRKDVSCTSGWSATRCDAKPNKKMAKKRKAAKKSARKPAKRKKASKKRRK